MLTVIVMTEEAARRYYDENDMRVAWRARSKILITCFYQWLEDIPIAWWIYMDPDTGEYWAVQHDFNWEAEPPAEPPAADDPHPDDHPMEEDEDLD